MSRLIVLPELPGERSGYQKAVAFDLRRLAPKPADVVLAYSTSPTPMPGFQVLPRPAMFSAGRFLNTLQGRVSNEPASALLAPYVEGLNPETIFCGEVVFYRALRKLFPAQRLTVRFHNFYTLLAYRQSFYLHPIGKRLELTTQAMVKLEHEIALDTNCDLVFIQPTEEQAFKFAYPDRETAVWNPAQEIVIGTGFLRPTKQRLIWFGGISAHKAFGLRIFIDRVFKPLHEELPNLELHLFGKNTEQFHLADEGIFGHGFYADPDFPMAGKGLYVNPDLLGGGIKIKIGDLLERGLPFISTPFGVEGYHLPTSDNLMVASLDKWVVRLRTYFG